MLRYMTDRARSGLVAFYDIRPGNGAGLFIQPRNPHGATRPINAETENASYLPKGRPTNFKLGRGV